LIRISWLKKIWNGRSKGISTVLGTVFLTLVIFAISTNVFLWTLSRNAEYTLAVKEENQKNIDQLNEYVIASGTNYSVSGDGITVKVTITNAGPVAAQMINLWVFDTTQQKYTNEPVDVSLNPGQASNRIFTVTISGANVSHDFVSWFVTARGNTVPLQTEEGVVIAELSQGIGSISMDFKTIRRYIPDENGELGPPAFNFSIPGGEATVFGIGLTNLDRSKLDINLTSRSCVWLIVPGTAASAAWPIAKVVDGVIQDSFDFQVLEYGKSTLLYFGATKPPSSLSDKIAAVNVLLYGTIGPNDYGQNIPFAAVYVEK